MKLFVLLVAFSAFNSFASTLPLKGCQIFNFDKHHNVAPFEYEKHLAVDKDVQLTLGDLNGCPRQLIYLKERIYTLTSAGKFACGYSTADIEPGDNWAEGQTLEQQKRIQCFKK